MQDNEGKGMGSSQPTFDLGRSFIRVVGTLFGMFVQKNCEINNSCIEEF